MALGGYADRVIKVDLTEGNVDFETIPDEWKAKFIGGRGFGVKYVFDNGPQVDPLSPENILCFMNGPITGTPVNMSGRMAVCTKSPLTGTITDSHHGGWSAARLRWAGLDYIEFDLVTSVDNMTYVKPRLEYYQQICEKIKAKPENCIMVGNDPFNDMIASNIGMKTHLTTDSDHLSIELSRELAKNSNLEMPKPDYKGPLKDLEKILSNLTDK